jgi:chromosome segregation protein
MEQGKIDSILQADPIERRSIFEEAAGISRFKSRRKEAERKLERTQANLLRLGDIIEELEKRIRSLKNQAGRARSYLKHSEKLNALKKDYYLHRYCLLIKEGNDIKACKIESESEEERLLCALAREKKEFAGLEKQMGLVGEELSSQKTLLAEIKTSLEENQGKIGYFENRIAEPNNKTRQGYSNTVSLPWRLLLKRRKRILGA